MSERPVFAEERPLIWGNTRGKCVILRLHRLKHLPPAYYATQILVENGVPVLVIEFGNVREVRTSVPGPIPTWRVQNPIARFFPRLRPVVCFIGTFMQVAWHFLRDGRPSLLIAHGMQEQCLAHALHLFFRVPIVVHVHEIYALKELDRFNRFFFSWGLSALRNAQFLIFPEKNRARLYQKWFKVNTPADIVFNTPRAMNVPARSELRDRLHLRNDSILMGYMGGIGSMQAFEETFLALVENPRVHFLIWGWGDADYLSELRGKAKAYRVKNRVHFLGETFEQKWEDLRGCDFSYCVYVPKVLRLQHAATASNKLMEAMAVGIPVLTSDSRDFKEIVQRWDVGLCADPQSSNSLAKAIRELATNDERRARQGLNALRAHQEIFNYDRQFLPSLQKISALTGGRRSLGPHELISPSVPPEKALEGGRRSPANLNSDSPSKVL